MAIEEEYTVEQGPRALGRIRPAPENFLTQDAIHASVKKRVTDAATSSAARSPRPWPASPPRKSYARRPIPFPPTAATPTS